jgi:hypothetical protein
VPPSMKGPLSRGLAGGNSPPVGSLIQAAAVLPLFRCANHRTCDRAFVLGWRLPSGVGRVFASIYLLSVPAPFGQSPNALFA